MHIKNSLRLFFIVSIIAKFAYFYNIAEKNCCRMQSAILCRGGIFTFARGTAYCINTGLPPVDMEANFYVLQSLF